MIENFNVINGQYEVANFDIEVEKAKEFIKQNSLLSLVIQNDDDLKSVKKSRTTINNKLHEIEDKRKDLLEAVLGKYNEESKTIEKMFKSESEALGEKINAYVGVVKEKTYIITVKSAQVDKINALKKYLDKVGLVYSEK